MTVVSLLTPSFVARQAGYALSGDWMDGDRATNEHYAPLETFEERYPLNSRLVKRDGTLVEEVYRVGGRYGVQIEAIVGEQSGLSGTATIMRRMVDRYGTAVPGLRPIGLTHTFPPPTVLATGVTCRNRRAGCG